MNSSRKLGAHIVAGIDRLQGGAAPASVGAHLPSGAGLLWNDEGAAAAGSLPGRSAQRGPRALPGKHHQARVSLCSLLTSLLRQRLHRQVGQPEAKPDERQGDTG